MSLLAIHALHKRFGNTKALQGLSLEVRRGEVHALMGENGAGKSTLINLINGLFAADSGSIVFDGAEIGAAGVAGSRRRGISTVFQEFSLVPEMTVEENLFLGSESTRCRILRKRTMRLRATQLMTQVGLRVAPDVPTSSLSRAEQQMVEIAKALLAEAKLLILDEPTASLSEGEAERLFDVMAALKRSGVAVLYVSHRMREIRRLADRITVLRDGVNIATRTPADADDRALIELMAGRKVELLYPEIPRTPGAMRLRVTCISTADESVREATLAVRAGEIIGIAGLAGCGKSELLRAIFGIQSLTEGAVEVDGATVGDPAPSKMLKRKLCYFTSDRVSEGLLLERPVRENMTISAVALGSMARFGILDLPGERRVAHRTCTTLGLRTSALEGPVAELSGGNRQKALLARGFTQATEIFLLDEPTVGIDIGAKAEIYLLVKGLVAQGAAVLLASSDLSEVVNLSHVVHVMREGRIVASLQDTQASEDEVLSHFFGAGDGQ